MNPALFRRRRREGSAVGSDPTLPPGDQANLTWAFDPDLTGVFAQSKVGPLATLATPVWTAGPPGFYTFGVTDKITYGNALDTTWSSANGFTIYIAMTRSTSTSSDILSKFDNGTQNSFWVLKAASDFVRVGVSYDGSVATNKEDHTCTTNALGAGHHIITCVFDPSKSFGSRTTIYIDNVSATVSNASAGTGTVGFAGTATLQQGATPGLFNVTTGVNVQSYIYAYKTAHAAGTVSSNYTFIHTTKGW